MVLLFGVSGGEIMLIFLVALLLFGSKGLPDVARSIGKGLKELQKATDEIKREINNSTSGTLDEISKIRNDITGNIAGTFTGINETVTSIKDPLSGINEAVNAAGQQAINPDTNTAGTATSPAPAAPSEETVNHAPPGTVAAMTGITHTTINLNDPHEVLRDPFNTSRENQTGQAVPKGEPEPPAGTEAKDK